LANALVGAIENDVAAFERRDALFVKREALFQRLFAGFELSDDLFELRQQLLERFVGVGIGRGSCVVGALRRHERSFQRSSQYRTARAGAQAAAGGVSVRGGMRQNETVGRGELFMERGRLARNCVRWSWFSRRACREVGSLI